MGKVSRLHVNFIKPTKKAVGITSYCNIKDGRMRLWVKVETESFIEKEETVLDYTATITYSDIQTAINGLVRCIMEKREKTNE